MRPACQPASARRTRRARAAVLLAGAAALGGCATTPPGDGPAATADAIRTETAAPSQGDGFPPGTLYRLLTAEFAIRRGEPELAVETYMDVARETQDAAVAERATRMAVYARDEQAGLDASRLWVELADDVEAHRVHAVLLVLAGKNEAAVRALRTIATRFDDGDGGGYRIVADLLSRERDKGERVALMQEVIANDADNPHAKIALAQVAARSDESAMALRLLREVYEADPSVDRYAAFYATMLRSQGKTEDALAVLATQLERHPEGSEIRMLYARFLVDARRFEEARKQFELLVENDPERSDVRYALGLLLLQTSHYADARVQFEELLAQGERSLEASFYLGQIAEAEERYEEAIEHYRQVDRGEQYLNAQVRVAAIYAETDRMDRARQHLSAVRRESVRDDVRLYRAEAELLASQDLYDEAIRVYDAGIEAYPDNTDLQYARAMMAAKVERFDVLEQDLRDILAREPNNADALNALGYTLADRDDRVDEAYDLIKRAYALKPDDHYIKDSMGWVLYRMGRLEEAVAHLREAMDIQADAEVAAHLGEVLWVLGRKEEAREVWETALKETPEDKRLLETIKRLSE